MTKIASFFMSFCVLMAWYVVHTKAISSSDAYLMHYWPITNGQMNDLAGGAHMVQGAQQVQFVNDRFDTPNSALDLSGGYAEVPSGVYLDTTEFTITFWMNLLANSSTYPRILDFGFPNLTSNIYFGFRPSPNYDAIFGAYTNGSLVIEASTAIGFTNNEWYFIAIKFDAVNFLLTIFINNGITVSYGIPTNYEAFSLNRPNNYIGKSNVPGNGFAQVYLDDLRFYNTSLNNSQIQELMMLQIPSKKPHFFLFLKLLLIYIEFSFCMIKPTCRFANKS